VDGINIKLAKCGGLREALRMIAVARAHDLMGMVGCMIESSLGITAAAHLTPLVDIVDLDGAALLADDPFEGATIQSGQVTLPSGPGLGVRRRRLSVSLESPSRCRSPLRTAIASPTPWATESVREPGLWFRSAAES